MITVAVDAMGGDFAPDEAIKGSYLAVQSDSNLTIHLYGPQDIIQEKLRELGITSDRMVVCHAPEVVGMSESPSLSFKKKKSSSIRLGLEAVKSGDCDGFVSAGNTGAVMTSSTLVLKRIKGIERPALSSSIPNVNGRTLLLDLGSNVDSKASHIQQFAVMGHFFSKLILGIDRPRVGLLNIGEEKEKGNALTQSAYALLEESDIHFIGNVESPDIFNDKADVVVCDGFVGNVVFKFGEGLVSFFMKMIKRECRKSWLSMLGAILMKPAFKRFMKQADYEEFGGAPLLGVAGVSVVAHGKSHQKAIMNAIFIAREAIKTNMVDQIQKAVS